MIFYILNSLINFNRDYSKEIKDAIEKNYYLLESSDLPKGLTGQIFLPIKSKD